MTDNDNLKYKRRSEIREEILSALDAEYGDRFQEDEGAGIRKQNLVLVAEALRPEDHTFSEETVMDRGEEREKTIADLTISELYSLIGRWIGVEYTGCSGNDWALNRPHLKAIHQELHDD